jgi:hypothetical protein
LAPLAVSDAAPASKAIACVFIISLLQKLKMPSARQVPARILVPAEVSNP